MKYHAHIYWKDSKEREVALAMRPSLRLMGCKMGRIWDNPIGPHPISMYQVNYDDTIKEEVVRFLKNNHGGISVLLHRDTGSDLEDHTRNIEWLGVAIKLDLTAFENER